MLRLNQIKLKADSPAKDYDLLLRNAIAGTLRINASEIGRLRIMRRSLDARKKPELSYVFLVDFEAKNEAAILKKASGNKAIAANLSVSNDKKYEFPFNNYLNSVENINNENISEKQKVVIIGSGPAGLFCGLYLAKAGFNPIIIERGEAVDERSKTVEEFWNTGKLKADSNVQFGEGGAGTFSDGKLNTLVKDAYGLNREVLEQFTIHGAPSDILYDAKPHIGTDILKNVVKNIRNSIIGYGGEIRYNCKATDFVIENGAVRAVCCSDGSNILCDAVVVAIGHSARDTFDVLYAKGIEMQQKPFAVGLRVQHRQKDINFSQYGKYEAGELGSAPYKVTAHSENGRGVFSFCMCPGGYVVNASSEEGMLAVNGMSYSGRDGDNANSAIIVSVTPEDFPGEHPLAGVAFQRDMEKRAFEAANGKMPLQRYGSFRDIINGSGAFDAFCCENSDLKPQVKGLYEWTDITNIMPEALNKSFVEGMEHFGRLIHGFNDDDVILAGIESRTSSPVRITRDENFQSNISGIFPCGEGAGYAGGIMSAAMDGIRVAEAVAKTLLTLNA